MSKKICAALTAAKLYFYKNVLNFIVGIAVALMVAVLANYLFSFPFVRSSDQAIWGQFGDYFGGVLNPFLSFLALIAVVVSLRNQSEEVAAARKEASAAISMQAEQTKVFQKQSFESVFFGLVQLHLKNVDRIKAPAEALELGAGTEFELITRLYNIDMIDNGLDPAARKVVLRTQYLQRQAIDYSNKFMSEFGNKIVHYFATLEEILKYIDSSSRPLAVDTGQYVSIFKALLAPEEIECLFMYSLSDKGKGLRPFMVQHKLWDLMPERRRLDLAKELLKS